MSNNSGVILAILAVIALVMPISWALHKLGNRATRLQAGCNPLAIELQPAPGQPAPGQPAPGQPAPGQPAPGQPAPAVIYDGNQNNRTWWLKAWLNDDKHTMLIGRTRSGKSTMAMLLLKACSQQGYKFVILDPHAKYSDWSGIRPYGRGKKYHEISAAIEALINEADQRFDRQDSEFDPVFEPLIVFIDEARGIAQNCPGAGEFFKAGSSEYAKIGIRLVILSQSMLVKALKFEGEGDLRENFNIIFLGSRAIQKLPWLKDTKRPGCAIWDDSDPIAIDTSFIVPLANGLQTDVTKKFELQLNIGSGVQVLKNDSVLASKTDSEKTRTIEILLQSGVTKTDIVNQLYGNRQENFKLVNEVANRIGV
jgi:hypothetical protein